jgi:hypothetical protein
MGSGQEMRPTIQSVERASPANAGERVKRRGLRLRLGQG